MSRDGASSWCFAVIPLLALVAVLPLFVHGVSCGHDFDFHLQSWLDAAAQLRHGTLDPAWTFSAAWNTGEPRFLFYPPLSWMLGALLSLVLPFSAVPIAFTALALAGAGWTMYRLARTYASAPAALLASAVYLANPYMLFTAFERTAYGELLAAVWLPLLIGAALRVQPTVLGVAVPLALLWLTNAPAAVIGVYALVGIAALRLVLELIRTHVRSAEAPGSISGALQLSLRYTAGLALGLALPAFYLLPAAYERRYVQVAMALITNMRVEDNFLFGHTGDAPHDRVLHTASTLAVSLLVVTCAALCIAWITDRKSRGRQVPRSSGTTSRALLGTLAAATAAIALLLTPLSLFIWRHVPELAFLQFPWRLLCLLGTVLGLAVALALRSLPSTRSFIALSAFASFVLVAASTALCIFEFRQGCEVLDRPDVREHLFLTHHGLPPTDEYTPTDADNDVLRWDDPGYWLAPDPKAFAPGTIANPAATIVNYDVPPPIEQTVAGSAPHHLDLTLAQPEALILNLRDYPDWQITRDGTPVMHRLQRDDGLLAIPLPAGRSVIDIRWRRTWDQELGDGISLGALVLAGGIALRSRTIKPDA